MSSKITSEHLCRGAAVYIRQSTLSQVLENTESQRRQYELAEAARAAGFASVTVIDDDLGRSGSGAAERPGFQKLAAAVCAGSVGAVYCIEASRLARNGRDWHHLIDLCALAGALVVDPDGVYDPRLVNDRLLLGLKGTMSEYELSLLRQRGLAARDAKAGRGELRFTLPPGYCWGENGRIEIDPDERVAGVIRLVFEKFHELGSSRQVYLWFLDAGAEPAGGAAQRRRAAHRVATGRLPHGAPDHEESDLCRGLRLRADRRANPDRRGARAKDRRSQAPDGRLGGCCCVTTTRATSPGSVSRRTSKRCWRTPI